MIKTNDTFFVAGLSGDAEIKVDRWGIPHISAMEETDLFIAQGFNAARDRLWQIDLWRKRGLGVLAADFGPGYLAQDYASRHFLYRGDMEAEWQSYGPQTKAICTAFARGINAYVELVRQDPKHLLPPEFQALNTTPAFWSPQDVVRIRTHALSRNGISEILRANVLTMSDQQTDLLRINIQPAADLNRHPEVNLADIPLAAADILKLASAPVTFDPDRLACSLDDAWRWSKANELGEFVPPQEKEGSNNWAVHGSRTASGRPMLASDPHRIHTMPSTRYLVHLRAGEINLIGAGEAVAPGICIGHNGQVAFGLTIFGADQEDVYVYRTSEPDLESYRYKDGWEQFRVLDETFAVKGCPDQVRSIKFSRHGPVVYECAEKRQSLAIRTVWTEPGSAPYLGSLAYLRSNTVAEFGASLTRWGTPSVNHVCADVNGDIAWYTAGFTPRRNNWSGLLPVPGNGDYEWQGFLPAQDLPWAVNPDVGYIGTANEMNIPDGYAHPIGFEWADASRAQRIKSVLADDQNHTLTASMALQLDAYSEPASVICGLLRTASRPTDDTGGQEQVSPDGLSLLESWDHVLDADSAAGMLFEIWWMKHLRPALFSRFAASKHTIKLLPPGDTGHMLSLLSNPSPRWTNEERDALLYATLAPAYAECVKLLGPNSDVWQWGALHQVVFEHQLNRQLAHIAEPVDIGPFALGGSRSTPVFAGYRPNDFRVIAGATVRLVIDVGDWDNSICINTPGQSGDPQSPHYADLASLWANGDYVPLYFSQPRIDEETVQTLVLKPLKS